MKINYWKGARGSDTLLQTHKDTITTILNGDFSGGQLEKLRGFSNPIVYSFRMNQANRLLFTTHHDHLLVLDCIENHDYQKSSFLKRGVLKRHLNALEEIDYFAPLDETEALPTFSHEEGEPIGLDYYNNQFIQLGTEQQEVLTSARLPLIINGAAGSGKTYLSLSLLHKKCQELDDNARLLYVSQNPMLVDAMQKIWNNDFAYSEQKDKVRFAHYSELMFPEFSSFACAIDYNIWLNNVKKISVIEDLTAEQIYHEFRICSAFTLDQYLALGMRQNSIHDLNQKEAIYSLYNRYMAHLNRSENRSKRIDPALIPPANLEEAFYDFIAVDESQNFSLNQLITLVQLAKNKAIVLNMDSHQNLMDYCPIRVLLPMYFHPIHFETQSLQQNYRYSQYVSKMLQEILLLKRTVFDGKLDKEETSCIRPQDNTFRGETYLLNQQEYSTQTFQRIRARAKSTEFAVVTQEAYLEEARAFFRTPLVFTPEQVQGQEFHTIIAYNCLPARNNKKLWKDIYSKLNSADINKVTNHRSKTKQESNRHLHWINAYFTACSRAIYSLVIVEESSNNLNSGHDLFLNYLKKCAKNDIMPEDIELNRNWREMAERQRLLHHDDVTNHIEQTLAEEEQHAPALKKMVTDDNNEPTKKIPSSSCIPVITNKGNKKRNDRFFTKLTKLFQQTDDQTTNVKIRDIINNEDFDCNKNDSNGYSYGYILMHTAINRKRFDLLLLLIEKSKTTFINPNQKHEERLALFSTEEVFSNPSLYDSLLRDPSIDINYHDDNTLPLLHYAVIKNNLDVVNFLLTQSGININQSEYKFKFTALMYAVCHNHQNIAARLLQDPNIDINLKGVKNKTALSYAAVQGPLPMFKLLLEHPGHNKKSMHSALLAALSALNYEIAEYLIDKNYRSTETELSDISDLILYSSAHGNCKMANYLFKKGLELNKGAINLNNKNDDGNTTLIYALDQKEFLFAQKLINEAVIDLSTTFTSRNINALMRASVDGDEETVTLLLAKKHTFNINHRDNSGVTALMIAVANGHLSIVKLLIEAGSDLQLKTKDDQTLLMLAAKDETAHDNSADIVSLLLQYPIDINARDLQGHTVLSLAVTNQKQDLVRLLLNQRNIDINSLTHDQRIKRFISFVVYNQLDLATILLDQDPTLLNSRLSNVSALISAVTQNSSNGVEWLLEKENIDVTGKIPLTEETILMRAVLWGSDAIVKKLLAQRDIDTTSRNKQKKSALDLALAFTSPQKRNAMLCDLLKNKIVLKEYLTQYMIPSKGACLKDNAVLIGLLRPHGEKILTFLKSARILELSSACHNDFLNELLVELRDSSPSLSIRNLWITTNNSKMYQPKTNLNTVILELEQLIEERKSQEQYSIAKKEK